MQKDANGGRLSAENEAARLKGLSMKAMREAEESYRNSVRAFQIAAMLASEAQAVLNEGRA